MKRRDFSLQLAGTGLGLTQADTAEAQGVPVEGQHYQRLSTPAPVQLPAGKNVEVVEFFSYASPHCFNLEQHLEAWVKTLPPDVFFRPVPVGFVMGRTWVPKIYYALEEIGQREAQHQRIFSALLVQRLPLLFESDAIKFLVGGGVNADKLGAALRSPAVRNKVSAADSLFSAYNANKVPIFGVQGLYTAEAIVQGSFERALLGLNHLIHLVRN